MSTVKSSNLPKIIRKPHHHLPTAGSSLKLDNGFKLPRPGPTFPRDVAAPPMADMKSNPNKPSTRAPIMKSSI